MHTKRLRWWAGTYACFFFGVHFTVGYAAALVDYQLSFTPGWLCPFIAAAWFTAGVIRITYLPQEG